MLASTRNSRFIRSTRTSRWSSPIPEMMVWPVSSSVRTWKVGSSSASRWIAVPLDHRLLVAHLVALNRRDVHRAGQEVHDRVQHRLHALVLERAAAQDRRDPAGNGGPADSGDELLHVGLGALQVQLHHLLV